MAEAKNRQYKLKERPTGRVSKANFEFVTTPADQPKNGEALIQNLYLSLDPTNRIWMTDTPQYMPPVQIGEVMRGLGIGKVLDSKNKRYKTGDLVSGLIGWQDYAVVSEDSRFPFTVLPKGLPIPLTAMLGPVGMTGLTAYFGLLDVCDPKKGETLVVSAAAGAVGSIVGQIGKIKGCRVVGIAGGDEKCKWLTSDLGFDAAVDYKKPDWKDKLKAACPKGVDVNFENVGGEIMNTVNSMMNLNGRVSLCGLISGYNEADSSKAQANMVPILMNRVKIQGFIITDFASRFQEGALQLGQWIMMGKIKYRETIVDGLEKAPEALNMLFDGENIGKLLVKISEG